MSFRTTSLAVALLVSSSMMVSGALADGRDPAAADALFREARALLKQKKYEQACPKLAESYRLDPAAGTLFNLAQCEEARGRTATAGERWQGLIDQLTTTGKLTDERLKVAREHVAALGPKIPKLELKIKTGAPPETVVLRDGVELRGASLGTSLPVDPGEHVVLVRAAYRKDVEKRITLKDGESKSLELEPGPEDGTRPAPQPTATTTASSAAPTTTTAPTTAAGPQDTSKPRAAEPSMRRPIGFVVGGVGLASLVGAGITGAVLMGNRATVQDHCNSSTKQCDAQGIDASKTGKTLAPVNAALWGVGLVGVGLGAYLVITGGPSGPSTAVGANAIPGGASVGVTGRF
ncbi:MAG: tetratricopeptide repeat protein [Polyangiaceae bacterium]